jgi:2-methylcitrate dehydratase PrpD
MTLARELVRAVRATAQAPLPENVAAAARLHLLDAIGVGLAAAGSPIGAAYRAFAAEIAKGGPASVFGQAMGASAADAALVNGGLIHSLEFDDTHTASIAHGSAVLAAAALAVAEAHDATGTALLGAYARGWEVLIRFGLAAPNGFHAKGFMSTSVTGTLASALLAAELMALDEDRTVAAIGIALSQASGVMEFLTNGSSVKSLHPGWAAHGGVVAALFARGNDRTGDLARRQTRPLPPVHRRRIRRRALPRIDRRPRPRMAPAESRVQVLSLLPLPASLHRGRQQARRARRARR